MPVGTVRNEPSFGVQETAVIGFRVDDPPKDQDFTIFIGDLPLSDDINAEDFGDTIRWRAGQHPSGTFGITPISLRDAKYGKILARSLALVEPSKLSTIAYETMFEDMRSISVELLLDLVSKSRLALSQSAPPRHGSVNRSCAPRIESSSAHLATILVNPRGDSRRTPCGVPDRDRHPTAQTRKETKLQNSSTICPARSRGTRRRSGGRITRTSDGRTQP